MSAGWKAYVVLNYVAGLVHAAIIILLLVFAVQRGLETEDLITYLPVLGGLLLMFINYVLNLTVYYRCFPDKPMSKRRKTLYILLTILFGICIIALLFLVTIGIISESSPDTEDQNTGIVMLSILIPLALMAVYIFMKQVSVLRLLRKNYQKKCCHRYQALAMKNKPACKIISALFSSHHPFAFLY